MQIQELFDIEKYIKVNNIKEVTSQALYSGSQTNFNPNGLFSEDIFGQTEDERSYRCAYIKLPIRLFNPNIAKTIIQRSGGIIKKMAYGEVKCNLVDHVLVADENGEYSGFEDLYSIWDEIDIRKTLTSRSEDNLDILIKSPKRLIFCDKVLVLPPNMRPLGMRNGKQVKSELNTLYMQLIGNKSVIAHMTSNRNQIFCKMQSILIDIYTFIANTISKKNGFLQRNLLAKDTAFCARNVISAPRYNRDDIPISVFRTGFPLNSICSMFNPFVKFHLKRFFTYDNIMTIHPIPNEVKSEDLRNIYDDRMIDTLMRIFMTNPGSRFKKLYLDPENTKPIMFVGMDITNNKRITRPLTLTDAIYLAAYDSVVRPNRMAYVVRYPIGDYLGAFFTQCHVLSTVDTVRMNIGGEEYPYYPIIDPELPHSKVSIMFAETVNMSNSRLKAIGGDYDGDTIKSTGIWSDEANKTAREKMFAKIYNITPQCSSVYSIEIECLNGLYSMTK